MHFSAYQRTFGTVAQIYYHRLCGTIPARKQITPVCSKAVVPRLLAEIHQRTAVQLITDQEMDFQWVRVTTL